MKAFGIKGLFTIAMLGAVTSGYGMGIEVFKNDKADLTIGGRMQLAGYGEYVTDPARSNGRVYMFMKQARLNLHGQVEGVKYNTEWVGAAEDINGSNNGLTLLDYAFDLPLGKIESTWVKVGQFKVPYGREMINDEGQLQFVEHSANFNGFNLGRDYGLAVHTYHGMLAATGGIFAGGSRDVPLRFLPERLGVPMLVARVGYNDGLDKDVYTVAQNDLNAKRTTKAAYINGMYFKNSEVGHSTVLGSRTSEKSWLMNTNWNPFINQGAPVAGNPATVSRLSKGDFYQIGGDLAARGPLGEGMTWNSEAQVDYGRFGNSYGDVEMFGARVQGGIAKKKVEFAARYSILFPDQHFRNGSTALTGTKPIHEVGPALTYYMRGHDIKIVTDAPVLINVPVFVERNIGTYVSTEQPDQATVTSPNTKGYAERQVVPQVRMMIQLAF
jgi:hypothetical protein